MPPYHVAVLPGDGVGPEVVAEARKVVDVLALPISWSELDWGSDHYHRTGRMMPDDAIETVGRHDAVLMGAVGDPSVPDHVTLWGLLLPMRQRLDLWANVRPARLLEGVPCPLAGKGPADVDMLFLRENSEGEYSGIGGRAHEGLPHEVGHRDERLHARGCRAGHPLRVRARRTAPRVVTSATKSNASRYGYVLWDEVAEGGRGGVSRTIRYERVLVDALAARMVRSPESLDVVVASNLFGDILTDLAAAIQGGMGMAASANVQPGNGRHRACSNRSTARHPTSPARASRTRAAASGARR